LAQQSSDSYFQTLKKERDLEPETRKKKPMARANISVDKAVFDSFAAQAMLEGKTLYAFTNEWLEAASRISGLGGKSKEAYDLWRSNITLRQFDSIVLPSDFVDEMVARLYKTDKTELLKSFGNLGRQLVGVLKIVAGDLDELSNLVKEFTPFTPIKTFETKMIDDSTAEMGIVGVGKRVESTECCYEFLKAVLNGYDFDVTSHEIYPGTIRLTARRRSEP